MAITEIKANTSQTTSATSHPVAFASGSATAGNLIVVVAKINTPNANVTIPAGFTLAGTSIDRGATNLCLVFYYKVATGGETGGTFTTATAVSSRWQIWEFNATNGWPADPVDKKQSTDGGASTLNSLSTGNTATTTQAEEIAVAAWAMSAGISSPSVTNSFTLINNTTALYATKILAATGVVESTASWTTAATVVAKVVTFAPSGAPSGGPVHSGFFGS